MLLNETVQSPDVLPAMSANQLDRLMPRRIPPRISGSRPSATRAEAIGNAVLRDIPGVDLSRWLCRLQRTELRRGQVLYGTGSDRLYAYFPTTAVVSLSCVLQEGESPEFAAIGNEGVIGSSLFMAGASTVSRAEVQHTGHALRVSVSMIEEEFARSPQIRHVILRFTQSLMNQVAQIAVCNRRHSLEQQLCRYMLLSIDRQRGSQVERTQESLARSLGVRREGVTTAALRLQRAGAIRYARGRIEILQRAALEARSCECYSAIRSELTTLAA